MFASQRGNFVDMSYIGLKSKNLDENTKAEQLCLAISNFRKNFNSKTNKALFKKLNPKE